MATSSSLSVLRRLALQAPRLTRGLKTSGAAKKGTEKYSHEEIVYGDGHHGLRKGYHYVRSSSASGVDLEGGGGGKQLAASSGLGVTGMLDPQGMARNHRWACTALSGGCRISDVG